MIQVSNGYRMLRLRFVAAKVAYHIDNCPLKSSLPAYAHESLKNIPNGLSAEQVPINLLFEKRSIPWRHLMWLILGGVEGGVNTRNLSHELIIELRAEKE